MAITTGYNSYAFDQSVYNLTLPPVEFFRFDASSYDSARYGPAGSFGFDRCVYDVARYNQNTISGYDLAKFGDSDFGFGVSRYNIDQYDQRPDTAQFDRSVYDGTTTYVSDDRYIPGRYNEALVPREHLVQIATEIQQRRMYIAEANQEIRQRRMHVASTTESTTRRMYITAAQREMFVRRTFSICALPQEVDLE